MTAITMTDIAAAGSFTLGDRTVNRMGYGAMQLAGPGVFGPPKDRAAALAVLREAVASGVNHIDTSDFYGPHVTNQLIREALHPYPDNLVIVTKVGAVRGDDASWNPAIAPADLTRAVHDNLRNLGVDALDVVNLRLMGRVHGPSEGSLEEPFAALAELQRQGLIRHLGLSNVTSAQVAEARGIAEVVCVQNLYNVVHRDDDALIDELDGLGHRLRALLPPRRLHAAAVLDPLGCGARARRDADAGGARLAPSPRAQHSPDSRHLIARSPAREPRGGRAQTVGRSAREARSNRRKECSLSATADSLQRRGTSRSSSVPRKRFNRAKATQ